MGPLFDRVLRLQTHWRQFGDHAHVPAEIFFLKHQNTISRHRSKDNSLLSYLKKISPIGQKMAELWPIGTLGAILAHNLARYQNFLMKLSVFDNYYQIAYSLQF